MIDRSAPPALRFPHPAPPAYGEPVEIAPGVLWVRLALPYRLDHVNIYLIEDGGGWAVLDTGLGDDRTRAVWEALLAGPLAGRRLTRLIVTHYHPDHVGLAGWLTTRHGIPLHMSQTEYLFSLSLQHVPGDFGAAAQREFYRQGGLSDEMADEVVGRGHNYLRSTTGLPSSYKRLLAGETLTVGGREFRILTGGGHAPEQVMLLSAADGLFFGADQVLARISPNVSVWASEPEADSLGLYLASLSALRREVPEDVLVLAAHNLPYYGLHTRIDELSRHHAVRCAEIEAAARAAPLTAAEIVPVLFRRRLDAHQTGFAFGEVLAHLNYMVRGGRLARLRGPDGIERFRTC